MIDTHSHIQFKTFDHDRFDVIQRAKEAGVEKIIAVGTDLESSRKALEVAEKFPDVYAAVGIHPHHVFSLLTAKGPTLSLVSEEILKLESLMKGRTHSKVAAIGETGLDAHVYPKTKYSNYDVTSQFLSLQEWFFIEQIKLALKYKKSLIIHNRGSTPKLLETLEKYWDPFFKKRAVFHCCEADQRLLDFAKKHQVFIGIDGDVTYDKVKQEFVKQIPLELLVLETDSPFFIPEPLKSAGIKRNTPENIIQILDFLSNYIGLDVRKMSRSNSAVLFKLAS